MSTAQHAKGHAISVVLQTTGHRVNRPISPPTSSQRGSSSIPTQQDRQPTEQSNSSRKRKRDEPRQRTATASSAPGAAPATGSKRQRADVSILLEFCVNQARS